MQADTEVNGLSLEQEKQQMTMEIPFIRLRFRAELLEDVYLPRTKTAALRGGMGEMLLRQNCVADQNCDKCRFSEVCVVQHTFYTPMKKKPPYMTGAESVGYLIECTDGKTEFKKMDCFYFYLILFGDSIAFFNQYLQAFYQLGMLGLGKYHGRFQITEVCNAKGERIVSRREVDMSRYRISTVNDYVRERKAQLIGGQKSWTLRFLTPLCMKHRQTFLREFDGEALVKGAARRLQMLNYYIGEEAAAPELDGYPQIVRQTIRQEYVKRYSGTQDSRMTLKGITGEAVFERIAEDCLDYLIAGELIHMGKNTSFGFGKYMIERNGKTYE